MAITVIGRPSAPGTPNAREGNATATVDVGRATVQRRPDRRLRAAHRGRLVRQRRRRHRLHVGRPHQRHARLVQRARPQQRRLGSVERPVARRDAGHRTRPPGFAERAVRRPGPHRHVVAAGQRGQRDHELRHPDRRQRLGGATHRRHDPVPLGRPDQRPGVHVPGARRERQGRGRVQLAVGPRAPVAPAGRAGRTGRRARRQVHHRQLGRPGQRRRPDHRVPGAARLHRARRTRRPARRSAGPTCPTANPSSSCVRARNRADWGPWSPASAAVIPCGVPDAADERRRDPAATRAPASRGRRPTTRAARSRATPCAPTAEAARPSAAGRRRRRSAASPTARATRSPSSPATRSATAPSARPPTPSSPPARRARRTSRAPNPAPGSVTVSWIAAVRQRQPDHRLPAVRQRRRLGERRHRHVVHPHRAGQRHAVLVPAAGRQHRGSGRRRQHRQRPHSRPAGAGRRRRPRLGSRTHRASWSAPSDNGKPIPRYEVDSQPGTVRNVRRHFDALGRLAPAPSTRPGPRLQRASAAAAGARPSGARTPRRAAINVSQAVPSASRTCTHPSCAHLQSRLRAGAEHQLPGRLLLVGRRPVRHRHVVRRAAAPAATSPGRPSCYFGYPGETVWVTLNGIRSNNTTW